MNPLVRFLCLGLLLLTASAATARPLPIPDPPTLDVDSYILMNAQSGQVLAAQDPDAPIEPASITKLMTIYIVFDEISKGNLALDDKVTISEHAWRMGGSKMFVEVGTQVSIDLLLHGVVTSSGNDATVALAEHIAGTENTFADYMNQYASNLGLTNSHFMNSTGWPAENHYMSARDIGKLMRALIQDFPELYDQYFHEKQFTYNDIKQYNRNSLLWTDDSVDGGKTGHTQAAGYCLVVSAKRDGTRLVSVVTGTSSNNARKASSSALLNYGFRFFDSGKLFDEGATITELRVWKGDTKMLPVVADGAVYITFPRGRRDALQTTAELPETLTAPVAEGERLGTLNVKYNGRTLEAIPLYAGTTIAEGGIIRSLTDEVLMLFE